MPGDAVAVAAALLHDVVEDCNVTIEYVEGIFGQEVADLVWWLTEFNERPHFNRATRKGLQRMKLSVAPTRAQLIKCADLLDNLPSIVQYDPKFASVFVHEMRGILAEFYTDEETAGHSLLQKAWDAADNVHRRLYP